MGGYFDDIQIGASASSGAESGGGVFSPTIYSGSEGNKMFLILAAVVIVAVFLIWRRK